MLDYFYNYLDTKYNDTENTGHDLKVKTCHIYIILENN
jgi:hypothetical protein